MYENPMPSIPFASARQTLPEKTYRGVVTRVLSTDPLKTETLAECPHRHRRAYKARECALRLLLDLDH